MLKILHLVSLGLGIVVVTTCFALYFEHYGFDQGLLVAEQSYENALNQVGVSLHGPRTYEFFANKYKYVGLLLTLFLICKIWEWRSIDAISVLGYAIQAICIASLVLIVVQIQEIFVQKNIRDEDLFLGQAYDSLLRNSLPYDWLCLISTFILLLIQVLNPLLYYFRRRGWVSLRQSQAYDGERAGYDGG